MDHKASSLGYNDLDYRRASETLGMSEERLRAVVSGRMRLDEDGCREKPSACVSMSLDEPPADSTFVFALAGMFGQPQTIDNGDGTYTHTWTCDDDPRSRVGKGRPDTAEERHITELLSPVFRDQPYYDDENYLLGFCRDGTEPVFDVHDRLVDCVRSEPGTLKSGIRDDFYPVFDSFGSLVGFCPHGTFAKIGLDSFECAEPECSGDFDMFCQGSDEPKRIDISEPPFPSIPRQLFEITKTIGRIGLALLRGEK